MKSRLRLLCGALLASLALSGCAEQILDTAGDDPTPSTTAGEEQTPITVAKFSTTEGVAPQPNAVVLASVNASLAASGSDTIDGVSRMMPLRIPFDARLADLYEASGAWDATAGIQLAQNLLIFPATNPASPVSPLPVDGAGTFKAVYQDANNDLVLVPGPTTFADNTTYVVAVKASLGDAQGNALSPDSLTAILTNPDPIVVDGKIVNTLVRSLYAQEADGGLATAMSLDGLRASYSQIAQGLRAAGAINSHTELAQIFTFTTEAVDPTVASATATLISTAQSSASNPTDNLSWTSVANLTGSSLVPAAAPEDLLSLVLASQSASIPSDNISELYKGYFSCTNFLTETEAGWVLDLENRAAAPGSDCPNSNEQLAGKIGFWVAKPVNNLEGIVIYQHGITSNKETMLALMNTMASKGLATVAMDIWGHGERTYEDANRNGDLADDSGALFMRPDNPALTVGYMIQTQLDLLRFRTLLEANPGLVTAIGNTPTVTPVYFVGMSLGGIIGSNLAGLGFPANRFVLNVPGGDLTDIILSGSFGPTIRATVAATLQLDTSTSEGQAELNSTMLGIDLSATHAIFKGGVDPLYTASTLAPASVLVQQMTGDAVIPNSNTDLLSLAMGLTTYSDGDGAQDNATRSRWILDPANYPGTGTAGHGFLLDASTTATPQGQLQAVCFLTSGIVLDPSAVIDPSTCTNVN